MNVNRAAINLIKEFEGFRAEAYLDPVNIWTIGYGTTAAAGVGIVPKRGMRITEEQAEGYLMKAVEKFAAQIRPLIKADITPNEFGAFVSLAYNIGPGAFAKSSALRKFNAGDRAGAANAMLLWNKAGGKVLKGLVRRREAEKALFLTGSVFAPQKPILQPQPVPQAPAPAETTQSPQAAKKPGVGAAIAALIAAIGAAVASQVQAVRDALPDWLVNLFTGD